MLVLTQAEEAQILQQRKKEAEKASKRAATQLLLQNAAAYDTWLHDNGRGSSFSTFVNEFCQGRPCDREIPEGMVNTVFGRIELLRACASDLWKDSDA